jgi:hypothetical protein
MEPTEMDEGICFSQAPAMCRMGAKDGMTTSAITPFRNATGRIQQ